MRVKLIITFLLTFLLFLGALIWRADQVIFGDQLGKTAAQNRLQISAVVDALDFEMQNISNILTLSFRDVESSTADYQAGTPYARFQMLAALNPPMNQGEEWQIGTAHFLEKTEVRTWATNYIALILKTIKPADFQMGSSHVFAINDPKRKPFLLLVSRGIRQWYVGLMGTDVFQKLMDRQKGQQQSVFIINNQGQALGHTTPEYVGKMLSEDPLVAEIIKLNLASGAGDFTNLKEEKVQGIYEKIPMSNLYVVLTTPVAPILGQQNEVRMQFIFMGLGLCLIGLALFIFMSRRDDDDEIDFSKMAAPAAPAVTLTPKAPAGGMSLVKSADSEKNSAYTKLASTLSHELKPPLTSILGSIQLALNLVSEQKAIEHLRRADREARSARDIVQKLVIFAGEDKVSSSVGSLEVILQKVLKNLESKISIKGIKLNKNIQSVPQFTMPADSVSKAIENIIVNAIEAMERVPQKTLTVSLASQGADIVLAIADTGEGMTAEAIDRAFDPFYTTRSGAQHVGLGLSTAKGIMKESNGDLSIESEKGKGTKVIMTFRPQENSLSGAGAEVPSSSVPAAPGGDVKNSTNSSIKLVTPKPATKPTVPGPLPDPLLVDHSIDKLIDGAEPEELVLESKKISIEASKELPPAPDSEFDEKTMDIIIEPSIEPVAAAPATEAVEPVAPPPVDKTFSAKIDRPNLDLKKKTSKLDEAPIAIRKPGVKS